jgi:hypothetical protein
MLIMTRAVRSCVIAVAALALTGSMSAAIALVPRQKPADQAAETGQTWPGQPMIPAPVPVSAAGAAAVPGLRNITVQGSLNWAGYAVTRPKTSFVAIRATFFIPYLDCAKSPGLTRSSDWVGFDGFAGRAESVEQGGIAADCSRSGKPAYYAWYEMFPRGEVRASLRVQPGDSVTAGVTYNRATRNFTIAVTDNTRGGHFSVVRKCPAVKVGKHVLTCLRNSAEVITEAPEVSAGHNVAISHLSDYGAVSFAGIFIVDSAGARGGVVSAHWNATKILQLRSTGPVIARPTPTQGAMFDNYWLQED